jgi:hypothetical protein
MNAFIANAIAVLLILLGFAALLMQKTYVDSSTRTVTSVELPLLGKLQTNYPALVFVFLGSGLSFFVFRAGVGADVKRPWTLTGSLKLPPHNDTKVDWKKTVVTVTPSDVWPDPVTDDGKYTIHANLPGGMPVEKAFDKLNFSNPGASTSIYVKQAHDDYGSSRELSGLENISGHTWTFKPKVVDVYPEASK